MTKRGRDMNDDGDMQGFCVVWNPDHPEPPKVRYPYLQACAVARRMATQYPGERFYVLAAVEFFEQAKPVDPPPLRRVQLYYQPQISVRTGAGEFGSTR